MYVVWQVGGHQRSQEPATAIFIPRSGLPCRGRRLLRHFGTHPRDYVLTSPPDTQKSDVYHVVTIAAFTEIRSHAAWTTTDTLFSVISSTSVPVFDSHHAQRSFSFSVESRPTLWAHPPPVHVDRDAYPTVKWPKCEADHLPPPTAKAKNSWN